MKPKSTCTVSECMTAIPIVIDLNASIRDAAKLMAKYNISSIIVQKEGEIVGIVTEKDMTRRVVAKGLDFSSPIRSIMTKGIISVSPTASVMDCAKVMLRYNIKHMPVVHNGMMLGIITAMGVLRAEPDCLECVSEIGVKRRKRSK